MEHRASFTAWCNTTVYLFGDADTLKSLLPDDDSIRPWFFDLLKARRV